MNQQELQIGIMGPGDNASQEEIGCAYEVGKLIVRTGLWHPLTGGRNTGVMHHALRGTYEEDPNVSRPVILPDSNTTRMSKYASSWVLTQMGEGRNFFNITSSNGVIFILDDFFKSSGTMTELFFAYKQARERLLPIALVVPGPFKKWKIMRQYLKEKECDENFFLTRKPEAAIDFLKVSLTS